jgi:DNA-binding NarL/FixJ family response regulator
MTTKVIIADDHKLFREGLKTLIARQPGVEVIGEAENGMAVVSLAQELNPDIVLMDVSMPDLNGIEATRKILADGSKVKVIILSMHFDRQFITEALKAGASGYMLKDSTIEELVEAIESARNNQIYLSSKITDVVIKDYIKIAKSGDSSAYAVLSAREREVLQLLAEGKSTKEIAAKLNVSVKTIETHRKQIMNKLNIHSIAELTKYAIREGLTQLG